MKFPVWLENFQIRFINPMAVPLARVVPGITVIKHRGRKSGRPLETAVSAYRKGDTVAIMLVGVTTNAAAAAEVHETMQHEGMAHMMPRTELPIAAGAVLTMQPGGLHVMLVDLRRALAVGDSIRLQLHFGDSTTGPVTVPVLTP